MNERMRKGQEREREKDQEREGEGGRAKGGRKEGERVGGRGKGGREWSGKKGRGKRGRKITESLCWKLNINSTYFFLYLTSLYFLMFYFTKCLSHSCKKKLMSKKKYSLFFLSK